MHRFSILAEKFEVGTVTLMHILCFVVHVTVERRGYTFVKFFWHKSKLHQK